MYSKHVTKKDIGAYINSLIASEIDQIKNKYRKNNNIIRKKKKKEENNNERYINL